MRLVAACGVGKANDRTKNAGCFIAALLICKDGKLKGTLNFDEFGSFAT